MADLDGEANRELIALQPQSMTEGSSGRIRRGAEWAALSIETAHRKAANARLA